jgi:hypothetical protein
MEDRWEDGLIQSHSKQDADGVVFKSQKRAVSDGSLTRLHRRHVAVAGHLVLWRAVHLVVGRPDGGPLPLVGHALSRGEVGLRRNALTENRPLEPSVGLGVEGVGR